MSGLNELMMACARRNHAAGIRPIGASQLCALFNSGSPNNVPLPKGSQAGDVVLLAGQATVTNTTYSVTPPSGSATIVAPVQFYTVGSAIFCGFAYLYTLTATDVANGTVPLVFNATAGGNFEVAAFAMRMRDGQAAIDGSVGQVLQTTLQALPAAMTAPGITTASPGDLLLYFAAISASTSNTTPAYAFSTPAGWSKAIDTFAQSQSPVSLSYLKQSAAGATGNITETLSRIDGTADSSAFGAWLFAVKQASTGGGSSGISIVEQKSFPISGSSAIPVTMAQPLKAGDTIIVTASMFYGATLTSVTDDSSRSYTQDVAFSGSNATGVQCWRAVVASDGAAPTITVKPSVSNFSGGNIYVLRGGTLKLDTANVVTNSVIVVGGNTATLGPFATSARTFALLLIASYQSNGTTMPTVQPSDFTADCAINADPSHPMRGQFASHAAYAAAKSGIAVNVTTYTPANNVTLTRSYIPYTY